MIYIDSSICLLSVIANLVRSPKLVAPFPDLSRTTDFNYKSRDAVEGVSLDVGEVVADQSCPMFALAAKPNMCTTSRLAAKPNPCFPPSLVKGVEGGTHWDFLGKKGRQKLVGLYRKLGPWYIDRAKKTKKNRRQNIGD